MNIAMHTPDLDPLLAKVTRMIKNKRGFVLSWAQSAAKEARANALAKGGKRYWRGLARSITVKSVSDNAAELTTNHIGAALKQYGGVIKPVNKRALTIPISPEAYGKTAGEFEVGQRTLFVLPSTRILGYSDKSGQFHGLFFLAVRAVQTPDPWFPSESRVARLGAREALLQYNKEQAQWNTR